MLEALFPDGLDKLPRLIEEKKQVHILYYLAMCTFDLKQAAALYYRTWHMYPFLKYPRIISAGILWLKLSHVLLLAGEIFESEYLARHVIGAGLSLPMEVDPSASLVQLAWVLALRGIKAESEEKLDIAFKTYKHLDKDDYSYKEGYKDSLLSELYEVRAIRALWLEQFTEAQRIAEEELSLGRKGSPSIWTSRVQGLVALGMGNVAKAEEHLSHALVDARSINDIWEELPVLVGLAKLHQQQGKFEAAREHLETIQELAERNTFRIYQADAFNILAQIHRDEGLLDEAAKAARKAYHLAWCDGPPFAYHWGLQTAKAHLAALNVPEPELPPFDQEKHKPMLDEGASSLNESWLFGDWDFEDLQS